LEAVAWWRGSSRRWRPWLAGHLRRWLPAAGRSLTSANGGAGHREGGELWPTSPAAVLPAAAGSTAGNRSQFHRLSLGAPPPAAHSSAASYGLQLYRPLLGAPSTATRRHWEHRPPPAHRSELRHGGPCNTTARSSTMVALAAMGSRGSAGRALQQQMGEDSAAWVGSWDVGRI
jgi:hypothetical protein